MLARFIIATRAIAAIIADIIIASARL